MKELEQFCEYIKIEIIKIFKKKSEKKFEKGDLNFR